MFPEVNTVVTVDSTQSSNYGTKSYLFDFEKGDFAIKDGKLVVCDGLETIKIWIEKILKTEKGRCKIYDGTDYGSHIEDLVIGNSYTAAFIEAELRREVEEALMQNPLIKGVTGFEIKRLANSITVRMEVSFGDTGGNIISVTV